ncbi:hypothetical protein FRB90_000143, partial [Tulasnella sp. 427]
MASTLRKLFPTFSSSAEQSRSPSPRQSDATQSMRRPKGAPIDLNMEDLLSAHLAERAARIFAAEEEETRQTLRVRASQPNPAPASPSAIPPPLPRVRARQHSQNQNQPQPQSIICRPVTEADLAQAEAQLHGIPHLHPLANQRILPDPLADLARNDLQKVRTAALTEISGIMKRCAGKPEDVRKAAVRMTTIRDACRSEGVPFGELLEAEVEDFGLTPLVIEIVRCDFQKAPELLLFLLEHSLSKNLRWKVRRGCMLRTDSSNLYETLRHLVPSSSAGKPWDPPPFEYETSISERISTSFLSLPSIPSTASQPTNQSNEFRALISIPSFPTALLADAIALAKRRHTPSEKLNGDPQSEAQRIDALLRAEAGLVVEFIACRRCWTLEVGSNRLVLTLVDGEPVDVLDARLTVVKEERPKLSRLRIDSDSVSAASRAPPLSAQQQPERSSTLPLSGTSQDLNPFATPSSTVRSFSTNTRIIPAVADLFKSLPPPPVSRPSPDLHVMIEPPTPLRLIPPRNSFPSISPPSPSPSPTSSTQPPPRPPRTPRPLILPRATLHPTPCRGQTNKITLAPCFPAYTSSTSNFVKSVLSSKELLVELVVRVDENVRSEDGELVGRGME